jgi:ubiquinone/menaquinone biosynthesis C-methylase UbiE
MLESTSYDTKPKSATAPLPPPYTRLNRHPVLPVPTHDETARMNVLLSLFSHANATIAPAMKHVYERRVAPDFEAKHGRPCATSREVRDAMSGDPAYQIWAALRREAQECRQQYGRAMTFRQIDRVNAAARALNAGSNRLRLDPDLAIPRYVTAVDNHCMTGGYTGAVSPVDVSPAANYESGHFVVAGGGTGPRSDLVGRSMAMFLKTERPDFHPKRILDVGAGGGFNTLPLAIAFPDAEVIALDVAAPMLRYGAARATAMGVHNVIFQQADGQRLPFDDNGLDLVISAMLWHETALTPMRTMLREIHRVLRPGGLTLHFEQPNFDAATPVFEKFMRDWDAWYNAEPFWAKLHTLSYRDETMAAGFAPETVFERMAPKHEEPGALPDWANPVNRHHAEHKLIDARSGAKRGGPMYFFGGVKS